MKYTGIITYNFIQYVFDVIYSSFLCFADTLQKKRKHSHIGENNSSGASEETDAGIGRITPRANVLRTSLGPQQRRRMRQQGPNHRYKTHDGSSIQEALLQLPPLLQPPMSLNTLPDCLAFLIQPAKSMHQLNSTALQTSQGFHGMSMGNLLKPQAINSRTFQSIETDAAISRTLPRAHRKPSAQERHIESLPLSLASDENQTVSEYSFDSSGRLAKLSRFGPSDILPSSSQRMGHSMGKSLPSSPSAMKSRSFDFKVESGPVTTAETTKPLHVRSLSHSSENTPSGRSSKRPVARQRLKSDTAFVSDRSSDFMEDHGMSCSAF